MPERVAHDLRDAFYLVVIVLVDRVYELLRQIQRRRDVVVFLMKSESVGRFLTELAQRHVRVPVAALRAVRHEQERHRGFSEIVGGVQRRFALVVGKIDERFVVCKSKRNCIMVVLDGDHERRVALIVFEVRLCALCEELVYKTARNFVIKILQHHRHRSSALGVRDAGSTRERVGYLHYLIVRLLAAMVAPRKLGTRAREVVPARPARAVRFGHVRARADQQLEHLVIAVKTREHKRSHAFAAAVGNVRVYDLAFYDRSYGVIKVMPYEQMKKRIFIRADRRGQFLCRRRRNKRVRLGYLLGGKKIVSAHTVVFPTAPPRHVLAVVARARLG